MPNYGLRLTLGGAAHHPHVVDGVRGLYQPDVPTPVGVPGAVSLEQAREIDANPSIPLELIDIADEQVDKLVEQSKQTRARSRKNAQEQLKRSPAQGGPDGAEVAQVLEELNSTGGENS